MRWQLRSDRRRSRPHLHAPADAARIGNWQADFRPEARRACHQQGAETFAPSSTLIGCNALRHLGDMTVDTIPPVAIPEVEEAQPRRRRRRPSLSGPPWLARVLVESFFIMFSILLALAVENWRENRQHRRLAQQSLQIFEREIRQNLARIDDVTPYHSGLRSVVAEALVNPAQAADMRSIVAGLQPTVLLNTSSQTSLATE